MQFNTSDLTSKPSIVSSRAEWNSTIYLVPKWKPKPQQRVDCRLSSQFPIRNIAHYVAQHAQGFQNEANLDFFKHLYRRYLINGWAVQETRLFKASGTIQVSQLPKRPKSKAQFVRLLISKTQDEIDLFGKLLEFLPRSIQQPTQIKQPYKSSIAYSIFELKLDNQIDKSLFQLQDVFLERILQLVSTQGLQQVGYYDYLTLKDIIQDRIRGLGDAKQFQKVLEIKRQLKSVDKLNRVVMQQQLSDEKPIYKRLTRWTHERTLYSEEMMKLASQVGLQAQLTDAREILSKQPTQENYIKLSTVGDNIQRQAQLSMLDILKSFGSGDYNEVAQLLDMQSNHQQEILSFNQELDQQLRYDESISEVNMNYISDQSYDNRIRNRSEYYEKFEAPSSSMDSINIKLIEEILIQNREQNQQLIYRVSPNALPKVLRQQTESKQTIQSQQEYQTEQSQLSSKQELQQSIKSELSFPYQTKQNTSKVLPQQNYQAPIQSRQPVISPDDTSMSFRLVKIPEASNETSPLVSEHMIPQLPSQQSHIENTTARSRITSILTKPSMHAPTKHDILNFADMQEHSEESATQQKSSEPIKIKDRSNISMPPLPLKTQQSSISNKQSDISPDRSRSVVRSPQNDPSPMDKRRSMSRAKSDLRITEKPVKRSAESRRTILNEDEMDQIKEEHEETVTNKKSKLKRQQSIKISPRRNATIMIPKMQIPVVSPEQEQKDFLIQLQENLKHMANSNHKISDIKDYIERVLQDVQGMNLNEEIIYNLQLYRRRTAELQQINTTANDIHFKMIQPKVELKLRSRPGDKNLKFSKNCNNLPHLPQIADQALSYVFMQGDEAQTDRPEYYVRDNYSILSPKPQPKVQNTENGVLQTSINKNRMLTPEIQTERVCSLLSGMQAKRERIVSLQKPAAVTNVKHRKNPTCVEYPYLAKYKPHIIATLRESKFNILLK